MLCPHDQGFEVIANEDGGTLICLNPKCLQVITSSLFPHALEYRRNSDSRRTRQPSRS